MEALAPVKRPRRSTSDLIREQQLRQACMAQSIQSASEAPGTTCTALDVIPQMAVQFAEPISQQVNMQDRAADSAKSFEAAARSGKRQLELAAAQEKQQDMRPVEPDLVLNSSEDLASDLSMKTALRFTTPQISFRWLRRLPLALRVQPLKALDAKSSLVRESVIEACKECLPQMMTEPDKAVVWMDRIAACLSWYQLEGPLVPSTPLVSNSSSTEDHLAWRRVEEWDEAFRCLETLLRQGLIPSFTIVAERFSITVFGEGTGPWLSPSKTPTPKPTQNTPCALLCPSLDEFRTMLQENHVQFEVANIDQNSNLQHSQEIPGQSQDAKTQAIVPTAGSSQKMMEEIRSDLRKLRRDGEKVVTPDEMNRVTPLSSALWFEGSLRVHALLDVLRQYFLGAPLSASPPSPPRLPRLVAPAPFSHAAVQSATVLKTQTVQNNNKELHTAELSGCFFPQQVRRFLELLRVLLPSFTCSLTADPRHSVGVNAFTQLGMRRIESVECKCITAGSSGATNWKWEFKLGA